MANPIEANKLSDAELTRMLDYGDIVQAHVRACRAEAFKRESNKRGTLPGYKLAAGQENRSWVNPDTVADKLATIGLERRHIYKEALASPAQIEAALKTIYRGKTKDLAVAMDKFSKLVKKQSSGQLSLVRDIDPREEVKRGQEFKQLNDKLTKQGSTVIDDDDLL